MPLSAHVFVCYSYTSAACRIWDIVRSQNKQQKGFTGYIDIFFSHSTNLGHTIISSIFCLVGYFYPPRHGSVGVIVSDTIPLLPFPLRARNTIPINQWNLLKNLNRYLQTQTNINLGRVMCKSVECKQISCANYIGQG